MKRLLYIGHPHATPDKEDWYKALQKKYECFFYNHKEDANYIVDIIYVHAGSVSPEILCRLINIKKERNNIKVVQWTGDCRDNLMPDVLRLGKECNITLLACGMGVQKEMYEKEVGRVEWFPHGVADWQFREVNPIAKGIVFIGNNYGLFSGDIARAEVCKKLKEVYKDDFKIYGNGWGELAEGTIPFEQTPDAYNNALISIDGSIFNDKDGYFSNRPLCAMAAGSLCFVREFPQYEKIFNHHSFITWNNIDSLIRNINMYLEDRNTAMAIARANQISMKKKFHYDALVERFDKIIYG